MGISVETVKTDAFSMDHVRFGSGKRTFVILPGLSVDSVMKYAYAVAEAYSPLTDDFTDGHRYLITELIYDSKTGQFKKGKVTDKDWAY